MKTTTLRAIEPGQDNTLFVILALVAQDDDNPDAIVGSRTHRFTLTPGDDIDAMIANVSTQLDALDAPFPSMLAGLGLDEKTQTIKYPPISAADQQKIADRVATEWTPEVLAVAKQRREAAAALYEKEKADAQAVALAAQMAEEARFEAFVAKREAARAKVR